MSDQAVSKRRRPAVFLSVKAADGDVGELLRGALVEHGVAVRTAEQSLDPTGEQAPSIGRMLHGVDGLVAVLSDPRSVHVEQEAIAALERGLDVMLVVVGATPVPEALAAAVRFDIPDSERASRDLFAREVAKADRDVAEKIARSPSFWLYAMSVDAQLLDALADPDGISRLDALAERYLDYRTVGSAREFDSIYAQMDFIADVADDEAIRARLRALRAKVQAGVSES